MLLCPNGLWTSLIIISKIDKRRKEFTVLNTYIVHLGPSIGVNFFKSSLDIYLYFHDNFCPETLCSSEESWWTRSRIFVIILSIAALLYLIVVAIILFVFKKKKEKKVEKILQDNTRDLYGDPNKAFQDDFFR